MAFEQRRPKHTIFKPTNHSGHRKLVLWTSTNINWDLMTWLWINRSFEVKKYPLLSKLPYSEQAQAYITYELWNIYIGDRQQNLFHLHLMIKNLYLTYIWYTHWFDMSPPTMAYSIHFKKIVSLLTGRTDNSLCSPVYLYQSINMDDRCTQLVFFNGCLALNEQQWITTIKMTFLHWQSVEASPTSGRYS